MAIPQTASRGRKEGGGAGGPARLVALEAETGLRARPPTAHLEHPSCLLGTGSQPIASSQTLALHGCRAYYWVTCQSALFPGHP